MGTVIEFNHVWKKFKRGEKLNSLRDTIPNLFRQFGKKQNARDLKESEFWAVKDVNFQVKKGEVVGIIGPNGAGKSTILKMLSRIMAPDEGITKINGRLSALIEVTAGFHPELTGRENVYLNGTILGMKKKELDEKFDAIVEFSGLKAFIDTPVKRYSSGMFSRLGFSVAAHVDPDVLLVDEVLSVGDIAFQSKCSEKMRELLSLGATIMIVSHNLQLIQSLCKRAILIDNGEVLKDGDPQEVIPFYEDIIYRSQLKDLKRKVEKAEYKVKVSEEAAVEITNVSFDQTEYKFADSISLTIEYNAKSRIENPVFNLDIFRADGIFCSTSSTKGQGGTSLQGKGSVTVNLGNMGLIPGIYMPAISIWDQDLIHPFAIRKKDVFRIGAGGFNVYTDAVLFPKVEWKMDHNKIF